MPRDDEFAVSSGQIASFINASHHGEDRTIRIPSSIANAKSGSLVFLMQGREDLLAILREIPDVVVITNLPVGVLPSATIVESSNPRLDFARVLQEFFSSSSQPTIHPSAVIHPEAQIGQDVSVGPNALIEEGVSVGDLAVIGANVVLRRGTRIGQRTRVKANTVIGEDGFGFEYDDKGVPVRIPHFGGVDIGNDVEIGALVVVARGTLDDTIVSDFVKIDDHVFIAHNVNVGESSLIIAGAEISGGVRIGRNVWIGPQASILEQISVGNGAMVGLGSVVIRSVPDGAVVAGSPARILRMI